MSERFGELVRRLMEPDACFFCLGRLVPYEGNLLKCERCGFIVDKDVASLLRRIFEAPLLRMLLR